MILSFGGPEGPDDVMPFLRNVTRGRNVPDDRLAEVAEQYALFGGRSPINDQCRELARVLTGRLTASEHDLPVYFGARNWHPFVTDTVQQMADDGIGRAVVFVTSAFGSYSGCRQYQEDLARARLEVDGRARSENSPPAPELQKLRLFYNHPGFIDPMVDAVAGGLEQLGSTGSTRIVFTAHSIPESMAAGCDYEAQLAEAARLVMHRLTERPGSGRPTASLDFDIVYQSRSGPPRIPWLEPDINDHLETLADQGVDGVVVVPIGFTSDHMEVLYDLDTQATATAEKLGLNMVRVPTVGTDERYVDMIIELIDEVVRGQTPVAIGNDGPWPTPCPDGHCPPPVRPRVT
jgi:ferrochelatase